MVRASRVLLAVLALGAGGALVYNSASGPRLPGPQPTATPVAVSASPAPVPTAAAVEEAVCKGAVYDGSQLRVVGALPDGMRPLSSCPKDEGPGVTSSWTATENERSRSLRLAQYPMSAKLPDGGDEVSVGKHQGRLSQAVVITGTSTPSASAAPQTATPAPVAYVLVWSDGEVQFMATSIGLTREELLAFAAGVRKP